MSSRSDTSDSDDGIRTEDEEEEIVTPPSTQQTVQHEDRVVYLPRRPARTEVWFHSSSVIPLGVYIVYGQSVGVH